MSGHLAPFRENHKLMSKKTFTIVISSEFCTFYLFNMATLLFFVCPLPRAKRYRVDLAEFKIDFCSNPLLSNFGNFLIQKKFTSMLSPSQKRISVLCFLMLNRCRTFYSILQCNNNNIFINKNLI